MTENVNETPAEDLPEGVELGADDGTVEVGEDEPEANDGDEDADHDEDEQ